MLTSRTTSTLLALALLLSACGAADGDAQVLPADGAETQDVPVIDSGGQPEAAVSPTSLAMGSASTDVTVVANEIRATTEAMTELFDEPFLLAEFSDLVGSGTIEAVLSGRQAIRSDGVGNLFRTTYAVRVDELVKGAIGEDGLVYLEITHSSLVSSDQIAEGTPKKSRVVFFASDSSDYNPRGAELVNPDGGRPLGSSEPIYGLHPQGFWFVSSEKPISFLEPGSWGQVAGLTGPEAEVALLAAAQKRSADGPADAVCIDFEDLVVDAIEGIDEVLKAEIATRLAEDDCVTQAELDEFWQLHPELDGARLGD